MKKTAALNIALLGLVLIIGALPTFPFQAEKVAVILVPSNLRTSDIDDAQVLEETRALISRGKFEGIYSIALELAGVSRIIYTHDAFFRAPYDIFTPNGAIRMYTSTGQPTNNLYLGGGYPIKIVTGAGEFNSSISFISFPPIQKSLWLILVEYIRQVL